MNKDFSEGDQIVLETKDLLFKFYYELMSEIKGKKIQIEEEEYEESLINTKIPTILHYIRESIGTLIKIKLSEEKKKENNNFSISNSNVYENQLRKYENDIRNLIKKNFITTIQKEALESKIEGYMEMEDSFEEMKEKLKYEEGKFLDNDKKDNEIFILRAENSNLKNVINKLEEAKKTIETECKNDKELIIDLKHQVDLLGQKVSKLEQKQKDFSSTPSNSSINININNNGNNSTKWVIKHEELIDKEYSTQNADTSSKKKTKERSDSEISSKQAKLYRQKGNYNCKDKGSNNSTRGQKTKLIDSNNFESTYNKILYDLSNPKTTNQSRKKLNHQKNNSMNMNLDNLKKVEIMQKYFSNQNSNPTASKNYTKITNLIPNSRFPITNRTINHNQHIFSSVSKIYMQSTKGNKTNNKSTLSLRSQSRGVEYH